MNAEQTPAPRSVKDVDRYREALKRIARNSDDRYAREIADEALAGGTDV